MSSSSPRKHEGYLSCLVDAAVRLEKIPDADRQPSSSKPSTGSDVESQQALSNHVVSDDGECMVPKPIHGSTQNRDAGTTGSSILMSIPELEHAMGSNSQEMEQLSQLIAANRGHEGKETAKYTTPRPLLAPKDVDLTQTEPTSSVSMKSKVTKKKRGPYKCNACGSYKKLHICAAATCTTLDSGTQTIRTKFYIGKDDKVLVIKPWKQSGGT